MNKKLLVTLLFFGISIELWSANQQPLFRSFTPPPVEFYDKVQDVGVTTKGSSKRARDGEEIFLQRKRKTINDDSLRQEYFINNLASLNWRQEWNNHINVSHRVLQSDDLDAYYNFLSDRWKRLSFETQTIQAYLLKDEINEVTFNRIEHVLNGYGDHVFTSAIQQNMVNPFHNGHSVISSVQRFMMNTCIRDLKKKIVLKKQKIAKIKEYKRREQIEIEKERAMNSNRQNSLSFRLIASKLYNGD
ncbi:MAG: hypothetical protein ACJAZS_000851 [Alteromonas naphthalenivorans]|jgi:hypothetical protein